MQNKTKKNRQKYDKIAFNNGWKITEKNKLCEELKQNINELSFVMSPYPVRLCLRRPGGVNAICKTGLETNLDILWFWKNNFQNTKADSNTKY